MKMILIEIKWKMLKKKELKKSKSKKSKKSKDIKEIKEPPVKEKIRYRLSSRGKNKTQSNKDIRHHKKEKKHL